MNSYESTGGAGADAGVSSAESVCSMWSSGGWINSLWRDVANNDFLVESMLTVRPPSVRGREGTETALRKFSRLEIISTGNVWNEVYLYPSHEYLMFTKRLDNLGAEQILRLTETRLEATKLRITLPKAVSCLRYQAHGESLLSLEWSGATSYAFYNPKSASTGTTVPPEYVNYYNRHQNIDIAIMPQPDNDKLKDLHIYMTTADDLRTRFFTFSRQAMAYENLARGVPKQRVNGDQDSLVGMFPSVYFPEAAAGGAPADAAWLNHLVTPPGSTAPDGGESGQVAWYSGYKKIPKRPWTSSSVTSAEPPYKIAPHSQVFHAGDERERLSFVATPIPGAHWTVVGDAGGAIVKQGDAHFYEPAKRPPNVAFSVPRETLIPAVTRASYPRVPARTDLVTAAGGDGARVSVSFVTTFVYPTNFIRFTRQGDALQLNCWYFNVENEETAVPPKDVQWHILAGNGGVSQAGVFIPASAEPSAVTVVMAVDTRAPHEWRFAVTIIPLPALSLRDVLRIQQT